MLKCGISQQLNQIRAHKQYFSEKLPRWYKSATWLKGCCMLRVVIFATADSAHKKSWYARIGGVFDLVEAALKTIIYSF